MSIKLYRPSRAVWGVSILLLAVNFMLGFVGRNPVTSHLGRFFVVSTFLVAAPALPDATAIEPSVGIGRQSLVQPMDVARLGLTEAWRRSLSTPAGAQSIVDVELLVHRKDPASYVEIVEVGAEAISAPDDDLNASAAADETAVLARIAFETPNEGGPVGRVGLVGGLPDQAEAERLARNEIRRLKRRGISAQMRTLEVPRIRLYTLSDDGTVECRDAETGQLQWLQRVGERSKGYTGIGADDFFTTVINGGELIKIDNRDGSLFDVLSLVHTPLRGAEHINGYALIPSVGNRIVGYPLADLGEVPFAEMVAGACLAPPAASVDSPKAAWGTSAGFVYFMELAGRPSVQFRLDTDGIIHGTPAAAPGERFFFGSDTGQLYGVRATRSGEVLWSRPTGQPIYQTPTVVGEQVLFLTAYGNLLSVNAEDGYQTWETAATGVRDLVGIVDGHIYARKLSGLFVQISLETGQVEATMGGTHPESLLFNRKTDRLYLIDAGGGVQCLRPVDRVMPTITGTVVLDTIEATENTEVPPNSGMAPGNESAIPPSNLFDGGGDDPFGAGAMDPFGAGSDDPFAPSSDDPFAPSDGAPDPFGDSPF